MKMLKKLTFPLTAGIIVCLFAVFLYVDFKAPKPMLQDDALRPLTLSVRNSSSGNTTVYVAFGADSTVLPAAWPFCVGSGLNCSFPLPTGATKDLPLGGQYVNATFSFGAAVTCGITKAEVNLNNSSWYDIADVSLVDGFSNKVSIALLAYTKGSKEITLGPPRGREGNEKVFGLFPLGCDICVARQKPSCGFPKGKDGCKAGTQYNPAVVCQYQGASKHGGQRVQIRLH